MVRVCSIFMLPYDGLEEHHKKIAEPGFDPGTSGFLLGVAYRSLTVWVFTHMCHMGLYP